MYEGTCNYCTSTCTRATVRGPRCGDRMVLRGYEECDDGNVIDTDGCTTACKRKIIWQTSNTPIPSTMSRDTITFSMSASSGITSFKYMTIQFYDGNQMMGSPIACQLSDTSRNSFGPACICPSSSLSSPYSISCEYTAVLCSNAPWPLISPSVRGYAVKAFNNNNVLMETTPIQYITMPTGRCLGFSSPAPVCGDGVVDVGTSEECDPGNTLSSIPANLNGKTCSDFEFNAGWINCTSSCVLNKNCWSCSDSDGGVDYYVKGTVTWRNSNGQEVTATDTCASNGIQLSEKYCASGNTYIDTKPPYTCPNGCRDGACLQVNNTNQTNTTVPKYKSASWACYDGTQGVSSQSTVGATCYTAPQLRLIADNFCRGNYGCGGQNTGDTTYKITLLGVDNNGKAGFQVGSVTEWIQKGSTSSNFGDLKIHLTDAFLLSTTDQTQNTAIFSVGNNNIRMSLGGTYSVYATINDFVSGNCGVNTFTLGEECTTQPPSQPTCGNNVKEGSEECDGTDLGEKTCRLLSYNELSYNAGTLRCNSNCRFDVTSCTRTTIEITVTGEATPVNERKTRVSASVSDTGSISRILIYIDNSPKRSCSATARTSGYSFSDCYYDVSNSGDHTYKVTATTKAGKQISDSGSFSIARSTSVTGRATERPTNIWEWLGKIL